jgi:hypothetical protein
VYSLLRPKTHQPPVNSGAGDVHHPQLLDDGFMQRLAFPTVIFADI